MSIPPTAEWVGCVQIEPVEKMGTPRGLWRGACYHPDHWRNAKLTGTHLWASAPGGASNAAVALTQHWAATHDQTREHHA